MGEKLLGGGKEKRRGGGFKMGEAEIFIGGGGQRNG